MAQFTDCLIIGAGQAGLAMSHCMGRLGIDHVVLERGRTANRWTSARWPSLRLLTPGWMSRMPGRQLASATDGFLSASELSSRLQDYAASNVLPVIEGVDVLALEGLSERFRAVTSRGTWIARSVVIATGACDRPRIPGWAASLGKDIHQLSSMAYRSPDALPDGGVLVVGASATGIQLAREIATAGRQTVIAAGGHVRTPRRYRGRDIFDWLDRCGFLGDKPKSGQSPASLARQPSMQLVGSDTMAEVDLYRLADLGVTVAGRAAGANGSVVGFADDLLPSLAKSEARRIRLLDRIDDHIARRRLDVPEDKAVRALPPLLGPLRGTMNLKAHGINTVLWATGYKRDYSWLHLDAVDCHGELRQRGGISTIPGLYALGLPFMRHRASSFIDGVGRDAEALAPIIAARLGANDTGALCAA